MRTRLRGIACVVTAFITIGASSAWAQDAAPLTFAGKRITLFIGFSPIGFGYDTYGRVLARYLGKHLPGQPTVVPQNRPGAGSLTLANYIYNAAPKDGTEIALVGRGIATDRLINGATATSQFDATKFAWLGSMNNEVAGFFIRRGAPAKTLQDVLSGTPLQVGSNGAGSDATIFSEALNAVLKTKLNVVSGYPGMNEILLSIAGGEMDGVLGYSWGVARLGSKDAIDRGDLRMILQLALQKHPALPNVPLVMDLVKSDADRQVFSLIFSRQAMGRPLVAPPGLPPQVVAALRRAVAETMVDPEFVAEAIKLRLEINFVSGEAVAELVSSLHQLPPAVIERAQQIASGKSPKPISAGDQK
ncbi:MAG: tripartite tricarboxylate transporter family receptor [Hyphomicrobiales bacterium]|nr:tripartite tricarboxylate transporter family receptor [Hyphomicrobiales bacterium]